MGLVSKRANRTFTGDAALKLSVDSMVAILSDRVKICTDSTRSTAKDCSIRLTDNYLSYRLSDFATEQTPEAVSSKENVVAVAVRDIIGCAVIRSEPLTRLPNESDFELKCRNRAAYLCVYAYPCLSKVRLSFSRQQKRVRKSFIFVVDRQDEVDKNTEIAEKWRSAILWLLVDKSKVVATSAEIAINIPRHSPKARNLLILINPASGPGKALEIFEQRVAPVLAETDIKFEVLTTQAAGNAANYIKSIPDLMLKWDGIVIVSGDGLLYEVFNGLMRRTDSSVAIKMPVGIIPGGSGNGLAHSVNHAVGERSTCNPVLASTLSIVSGRHSPMDLVKVTTATDTYYSFLSIGWGLLADIDIESERLRMVGGARFTIWALVRTMSLRRFKGKLSYLPLPGFEKEHLNHEKTSNRIATSKTLDCLSARAATADSSRSLSLNGTETILSDNIPNHCNERFTSSEVIHGPKHGGDCLEAVIEGATVKEFNKLNLNIPSLDEDIPEDWVTIEGDFVQVYTGQQTHLSADCFFAPKAKLDDGVIWLLFICGNVGRTQVLQFLTALDSGTHVDLPFLTMVPVRAFRLEPHNCEGRVTIDGELVPTSVLQAEVMPSIARVMTR